MKLKSLILTNFKGIEHFAMDPNGDNIAIHGDNGTGKTTIADSVAFLLYGLDSQGNTFVPKSLDDKGEALHGVNSEVEAIFLVDDTEITLRKEFKELFTKKHGSPKKVFTGHTVKHFWESVPISEKEYKKRLAEIAPEQVFKLLTSTRYFSEGLHWQQRREILLDICGDISDKDIIASNKMLIKIPGILDGKTFDERKKIITAQKTKLNKELNEIPVRIDEATKGQPGITGLDLPAIKKELSKIAKALIGKNEEVARIESGGEIAEKTKKQREIEGKLLEIENSINEAQNKIKSEQRKQALEAETAQRKKVAGLEAEKEGVQSSRDRVLKAIKDRETTDKAAEQEIIELRVLWNTINDRIFNEIDTICPTCGQDYPEEKADEIRGKFHVDKAEQLRKTNENGRAVGVEIIERKNLNETDQADISIYEEKIEELMKQISEAKAQASEPGKEPEKKEPLKNKKQEALEIDLTELKLNIERLRADSGEALETVKSKIVALNEKQADVNQNKQTLESHKKGQVRIKELGNQQKTVAAEYEKLESDLYAMDLFLRKKVNLLEGKVNSRFSMAKFRLFTKLVNGALEPCCETTCDGIGYNAGLNFSSQIKIGLDIINTLSEHFHVELPLFIDSAESCTELTPTNLQTIRLIVDPKYKQLSVKKEEEND